MVMEIIMAQEFVREDRYVVVKMKQLNQGQLEALCEFFADWEIPTVESVVIEKCNDAFEPVWKLLEDNLKNGGGDGT
jgi:hypothetical protein